MKTRRSMLLTAEAYSIRALLEIMEMGQSSLHIYFILISLCGGMRIWLMYLSHVMNHPRVLSMVAQILLIISNRVIKHTLWMNHSSTQFSLSLDSNHWIQNSHRPIRANHLSAGFAEFHTEMNAGKFSFISYNVCSHSETKSCGII